MKNDERLTDQRVRDLSCPSTGAKIVYDPDVAGFGVRLTAGGARAFVLNYRTRAGRERRYTIGAASEWSTPAARAFAKELKRKIRHEGHDPLADLEAERAAPTIGRLCDQFTESYINSGKLRPATADLYRMLIEGPTAKPRRGARRQAAFEGLRRVWGSRKVEEITFDDVQAVHLRVSRAAPYVANRLVSLLSRMFSLAVRWKWRTDNPAKGIERNLEVKRQRFLRPEEIARLTAVLAEFPDQQAANIVRLLVLTGARRNEVLAMRWDQVDLTAGVWTKPGHATKSKTEHRVPLSAPALQLLVELSASRPNGPWVFPGVGASGHRDGLKSAWPRICKAAGLVRADGRPDVRIHDLRHSFASILASAGHSLPIIGALLGHTQPATTARYAHLFDDPLRAATERVAEAVAGGSAHS